MEQRDTSQKFALRGELEVVSREVKSLRREADERAWARYKAIREETERILEEGRIRDVVRKETAGVIGALKKRVDSLREEPASGRVMDSRDQRVLGELKESVDALREELARARIREEVDDERIRAAVREHAEGRRAGGGDAE